jgi:hypothetical protein
VEILDAALLSTLLSVLFVKNSTLFTQVWEIDMCDILYKTEAPVTQKCQGHSIFKDNTIVFYVNFKPVAIWQIPTHLTPINTPRSKPATKDHPYKGRSMYTPLSDDHVLTLESKQVECWRFNKETSNFVLFCFVLFCLLYFNAPQNHGT